MGDENCTVLKLRLIHKLAVCLIIFFLNRPWCILIIHYIQLLSYCQTMQTSEKFCLRWNDFQENVNTAFSDLRKDCDFTDVTLASEDGQQIEAHKVILSAGPTSKVRITNVRMSSNYQCFYSIVKLKKCKYLVFAKM